MIGIRELARHLDISIGTVSRALNDKVDVNPLTRDRVREAAARLGYSPNQSGRSLRRGKTDLVGVIIPVSSDNALINTVFLSVLDGLRRSLSEARLDLAIFLHGQDEDIFGSLRRLIERSLVDGVIIANTLRLDPRIDYLIDKHRPFVAFGRSLSGGKHPWVDPDFAAAVEGAIEHLTALGHRRIALTLPPGEIHYLHLIVGAYRQAMMRRGLEIEPGWLQRTPAHESGGYDAGDALLAASTAPTAYLVSDTRQTIGLYRKLAEIGMRPGREVAVIGLLPDQTVQTLSPVLTSFVTDWTAVGARLGEALIGALGQADASRSKSSAKPTQVVAPVKFQSGESVNRPKI